MSVCVKCAKPVIRSDKGKIQCKACKGYFHWNCVNLSEVEVDVISASSAGWVCETCTKKKRASRSFSDSGSIDKHDKMVTMEDIGGMLEEMKKEILQGQSNLEKELGRSLTHCLELITDNNKLIADQKKQLEEHQRVITSLREVNSRLHCQVQELSERQTDMEQYSRRNTLEVFGVPEEPNETTTTLKKKVVEIGAALGATLTEEGIDACHRIGGGNNRPTSGIIVKFLRRDDADNLIQRRKIKRDFSTRHLPGHKDDSPVYINLSLAPARRVLFAKSRKLKTDYNYKYVWVDRAGRVKVRRSDDRASKVIVISSEEVLGELIERETQRSAKA